MYIIGKREIEAVRRVIERKQLFRYCGAEGETESFEREWSERIGVRRTIAVSSGTGALICAMAGIGVGPGDEVIVPGYTFMATALAPLAVGAVPIIAEVDASLTLDPADVKKKITRRTKAIIPVHMNGLPSNMRAIMAIARKHKLKVVEDACQAVGGSYGGKRLGSIGHAGAFSFNQYKNITCGEGGAVCTDDDVIFERARIFHDGGCVFRDDAAELRHPMFAGMNFRINEILSAIMRVQNSRLETILKRLRGEKAYIRKALDGVPGLTFSPVNDVDGDSASAVAWIFDTEERAERFVDELEKRGVGAGRPIHTGRHVYSNWEPVLKKRGSHHPKLDAFRLAKSPVKYTKNMCPNTLSILARTVTIGTSATRKRPELKEYVGRIKAAAGDA